MDEKIIKLAIDLHGHLAPGIALGLRMSELSLSHMGLSKGNKYLIGISETARCLADAIGNIKTKKGVRVALKDEANNLSPLMNKWMTNIF